MMRHPPLRALLLLLHTSSIISSVEDLLGSTIADVVAEQERRAVALEGRARGRRLREHGDDPAAVVPRVVLGARRRREAGAVLAEA